MVDGIRVVTKDEVNQSADGGTARPSNSSHSGRHNAPLS